MGNIYQDYKKNHVFIYKDKQKYLYAIGLDSKNISLKSVHSSTKILF